jgi:hypothetical protein
MLRRLYLQLLWAHPEQFRQYFGDEMLEAFDMARGRSEQLELVLDAAVSFSRQWVLRTDFHEPWQPATANGPAYEPVTFHQIEPYKPNRVALAQGGLAAVLLLFGVVGAINYGGGKIRDFVIGMRRPGFGLIKVNRTAFEGQPLIAAEMARDLEDPLRPFARSYFKIVHVLPALDADGDLTISAAEMEAAPAALRTLDLNRDGKLSAAECGFLAPGDFSGSASQLNPYRREFMRRNPLVAALDTDGDGVISESEIANSAAALRSLDLESTGSLTPYDLLPHPGVSLAAALIARFDTTDSGVISIQGLPTDDPDLESVRAILTAADRNHDGVVTRGELVIEMASRGAVSMPPPPPSFR